MDQVQRLTQAYSQAPWRKQVQIIGPFSLVLVFLALVVGLYLNINDRTASAGREIQEMRGEIDTIQRANTDLQSKLGFLTAASEMKKRVLALGFKPVEGDQIFYLAVPGFTERQPAILAPAPVRVVTGAAILPPEYSESIFEWLRKQALKSFLPFLEVLP